MGDHVCPWWLAYSFDNPLRRLVHDPERVIAPYVTRGMTVLDAGCGMGFFSIAAARLVGDEGAVVAADVQQQMLDTVEARARRAGVSGRIRLHRCAPDDLGVEARAGFILAFWMVHEVPDAKRFFRQALSCLAPGGKLLVAEPLGHVSSARFAAIVAVGAGRRADPVWLAGDPAQQIDPARGRASSARTRRDSGIRMIGAPDARGPSSRGSPRNGEVAGMRARLTARELAGIALTVLSYAVGWPAVALVGGLSVRMGEPLLAALGIPSLLVASHLTFALGLYLAGGRRLAGFVRQVWRSRAR